MFDIRPYAPADWASVWAVLEPVFRAGETYVFSPDISEEQAQAAWTEPPAETFVAVSATGEVCGTFVIKPNQTGLGAHVANGSYAVAEKARGQGLATRMCLASQRLAKERGYRALQFNLVVSTNEAAIRAWSRCGMEIVGTLPNAFRHSAHGYVDAHVMYKEL